MPFEKGHNQSTGRPKGSTNIISKEIRELSAMLLQGELENFKEKLPKLKDADYIKAIGMLMKHVLPAQRQIELDTTLEHTQFQIEIIDRIEQVSSKDIDKGIDAWVDDKRNK